VTRQQWLKIDLNKYDQSVVYLLTIRRAHTRAKLEEVRWKTCEDTRKLPKYIGVLVTGGICSRVVGSAIV